MSTPNHQIRHNLNPVREFTFRWVWEAFLRRPRPWLSWKADAESGANLLKRCVQLSKSQSLRRHSQVRTRRIELARRNRIMAHSELRVGDEFPVADNIKLT